MYKLLRIHTRAHNLELHHASAARPAASEAPSRAVSAVTAPLALGAGELALGAGEAGKKLPVPGSISQYSATTSVLVSSLVPQLSSGSSSSASSCIDHVHFGFASHLLLHWDLFNMLYESMRFD